MFIKDSMKESMANLRICLGVPNGVGSLKCPSLQKVLID